MPYISPAKHRRDELDPFCPTGHDTDVAETEGELNFQISVLLNAYVLKHGLNYGNLGDCTSACENAAAEFRRRVMAPYEDMKIIENGDVYAGALRLMFGPPAL